MMNRIKKIAIISLTSITCFAVGSGTFALWFDKTEQSASLVNLSQTYLHYNQNDFHGLSNIDGANAHNSNDNHEITYETQTALFNDDVIQNLIQGDANGNRMLNSVIEFDGNSTTHRGIKASVDSTDLKNSLSNNEELFTGWVAAPEQCDNEILTQNPSLINEDSEKIILSAYDSTSDQTSIRNNKAYYCVSVKLASDEGDDGTYTNIGKVTGTTGEDNDVTVVSAEDSWTASVKTNVKDYSDLQDSLANNGLKINVSSFRD